MDVHFIPAKVCRVRAVDRGPNYRTEVTDAAGSVDVMEEIPQVMQMLESHGIRFVRLMRKGAPTFFVVHNILRMRDIAHPNEHEQCEVVDENGGLRISTPLSEVLNIVDEAMGGKG